jgi:hypothetical protein
VTTYPQAAANWVGIDGDSYTSALLQSGTVCKVCLGCPWQAGSIYETDSLVPSRLTTPPVSSGVSFPKQTHPGSQLKILTAVLLQKRSLVAMGALGRLHHLLHAQCVPSLPPLPVIHHLC